MEQIKRRSLDQRQINISNAEDENSVVPDVGDVESTARLVEAQTPRRERRRSDDVALRDELLDNAERLTQQQHPFVFAVGDEYASLSIDGETERTVER